MWVRIAALALLAPGAVMAQTREPLGGLYGDIRIVTSTLPSGPGWTPTLATGALVPGRGFGADAGAHVFVGPGRHRRLSVGVTGLAGQGRAAGVDPAPAVTTRFFAAAPHASMNFGHAQGWSYLGLGLGLAKVSSTYTGAPTESASWGSVVHYGGGARWFLTPRVAVGLDLRFWALTPKPATATRPRGAATTRVAFGAGVSFR